MENHNFKKFSPETEENSPSKNELIESEINLRRQIEESAAESYYLPHEGKVIEDYIFEQIDESGVVKQVKLSELFEPGKDSLMVYSCVINDEDNFLSSSSKSICDAVNGMLFYADQKVKIVIESESPIENLAECSKIFGWDNLHLLSSAKNNFDKNFGDEEPEKEWPILNVFRKTEDGIYHSYATELLYTPQQNDTGKIDQDAVLPLWNVYDLICEEI